MRDTKTQSQLVTRQHIQYLPNIQQSKVVLLTLDVLNSQYPAEPADTGLLVLAERSQELKSEVLNDERPI
jgi:hypothetical protein